MHTNLGETARARRAGIAAVSANALTVDPAEYPELYGNGNVLAATDNENLNTLVCQRWRREIPDAAAAAAVAGITFPDLCSRLIQAAIVRKGR